MGLNVMLHLNYSHGRWGPLCAEVPKLLPDKKIYSKVTDVYCIRLMCYFKGNRCVSVLFKTHVLFSAQCQSNIYHHLKHIHYFTIISTPLLGRSKFRRLMELFGLCMTCPLGDNSAVGNFGEFSDECQ